MAWVIQRPKGLCSLRPSAFVDDADVEFLELLLGD